MARMNPVVKLVPLALLFVFLCTTARAQDEFPKPHMLYFYNPSCRLCTKTNEVVGATETKYKDRMSFQRFNIADPKEGTDNVLYMFDLMDEMKVPEEDETTLVVFVGLLEKDGEEIFFTPKHVLVEGDEIIEKVDRTVRDFLDTGAKGGVSVGSALPTSFFLAHRPGCRAAS